MALVDGPTLVTGAAGSFGKRFLSTMADQFSSIYALDQADKVGVTSRNITYIPFRLGSNDPYPFDHMRFHTIVHAAAALPTHSPAEIQLTDVTALDDLIQ